MSSKTFTFNTIIPRITSVVKGESQPRKADAPKRATGRVLVARSAAAAPSSRARSGQSNLVSLVSATALVVIVVALGFYVYMINAYASKGYELKRQQAAMQEVLETNKRLVVQQAALGSIVKVNDVAATSGMVPVTGEEFLAAHQLSAR
jgi:hypothetical protein